MDKILMFDMQNVCWRSQHAMVPLTIDTFGEITAVFGGLKTMLKVARDFGENWDHVYCCFDTLQSHRKQIIPSYKSKRHDPEKIELKSRFNKQMDYFFIILGHLGFTPLRIDGFEADDLIAQISKDNPDAFKVIVSNDEDLYQVLDTNTIIYRAGNKTYHKVDINSFREQYGIEPTQWAMVKAIAGCESDDVEGIAGVAEKRAIQYLTGNLSPKYKTKITEGQEIIDQNLRLVVLPYQEQRLPELPKKKFAFNGEYFERLCEVLHFRSFNMEEWEIIWTMA